MGCRSAVHGPGIRLQQSRSDGTRGCFAAAASSHIEFRLFVNSAAVVDQLTQSNGDDEITERHEFVERLRKENAIAQYAEQVIVTRLPVFDRLGYGLE